jgi:hypothetical protein
MNQASKQNRRNNRRRPRAPAGNVEQKVVSMYAPRRIYPNASIIPDVQNTVRVNKVCGFNVASTMDPQHIRVTDIAAAVPGGTTYWSRIRIQKITVWADGQVVASSSSSVSTPLTINLLASVNWSQPAMSFTDNGTAGAERAVVGFKLGMLDQARWFGTADNVTLFTISNPADRQITVHATVELMGPSGV